MNGGLGQTDCAELAFSHLDLKARTLAYPRGKTGIDRRVILWPESVEAIEEAISTRSSPRELQFDNLVFITKYGHPWVRLDKRTDAVQLEFQKLLTKAGLNRHGIGFYALRHTYRTIADDTRDFPAIDLTMGHVDPSIAGRYRERISDERLEAVAEHVRNWLFPDKI